MGILDKKSRIIHFRLTDTGRDLLSRGQLDFKYYKFFDDGVDYTLSDEDIVNEVMIPETEYNSSVLCARSLSTIEATDSHVKPYMTVSKNAVTLKKRQQDSVDLARVTLTGIVDVYIESDIFQFENEEPIYIADSQGNYVPLPMTAVLPPIDSTIEGENEPDEPQTTVSEFNLMPTTQVNTVLSISDPEVVDLQLVGATIQDGFKIEVFYSGTLDESIGKAHIIKLSENSIDESYKSYYASDESMPNDIVAGYKSWFTIVPQEESK